MHYGTPLTNHIAILLDRSGSMQSVAAGVIKQYNQQTQFLTQKAEQTGQKTHFSLYTFADQADQPVLVEVPLDLVSLKPLDSNTYRPNGMTAMLASIQLATKQLGQFGRGVNDSYLLIVITDGDENVTMQWEEANRLIRNQSALENWSYVFLVPKGKKSALLSRLPAVYEGNVREWDQTDRGVEEYSRATTQGLGAYFDARAKGAKNTKGFFTTNLSNVTAAAVKTLEDVTGKYRKNTVMTADCDTTDAKKNKCVVIKDFCKKYFGDFHEGSAYYSLTKKEKVQHGKLIVIEERTTGKLYGGDEAKDLLGLPKFGEFTVEPGDHGKYCVYIQSTSNNRKLVEGQTVLYYDPHPVGVTA